MKAINILLALIAGSAASVFAQAQTHDALDLTYNGEIGRIINENCAVCHREGGIGPMAF